MMDYHFSSRMSKFSSSAVRDILKLTQGNAIISFAGGLPAEELFPLEAVREAFDRVFEQGKSALQYGLTEGYTPLREALVERMKTKGMHVTKDDMLITTGSQQSIDLVTRVFIDPGDVVLVQRPTYLAALQVFQAAGAEIVSVSGDEDGMDLADAEQKLAQHKPKLMYIGPTFSNPTGYVWSRERREGIVRLARKYGVVILEDDPYGELQYGGDAAYPSIFSLDQHPEGSVVLYTSTFSKTVVPALRTGWIIGDSEIIRNMARAKQAADLHSSSMDQQALYHLLKHFDLDAHIRLIRKHYEERMHLMTKLLEPLAEQGLRWNVPKGGMFLWGELPEGYIAEDLLKLAVREGVAFVPGSSFFADNPRRNAMRINFTHTHPDQMATGVQCLSRALEAYKQSL
jgi:2-aminoadipate transaminase